MRAFILKLIARQVWDSTLKRPGTRWMIGVFYVLLLFALFSGYRQLQQQQHTVAEFSHEVRERWENNPDKHPHRMAHYGYVVFRERFPLSFFDFGMDSYLGNAVFLEAHRQNTVNFSEASLSNGLLRFGEISAGMVLQLMLPLLIFFWGFDLVSREREHGTLRILLTQGISWPELILGKSLGLFLLALTVLLPAVALGGILLAANPATADHPQAYIRFATLIVSYLVYVWILALLAVYISARSRSSKSSLTMLIGCWLFFTLMLPKLAQVAGQTLVPSPSKIEFDTAVEAELIRQGDSHNPNDPHFAALKDSLLAAHGVDSTHKLPFNYGGYVMREGERLSAETYRQHQARLVNLYQQQQNVVRLTALINPYMAIKTLSMALSGTDFGAYDDFQNQAEAYRYRLAQTMNELQINYVSNKVKSSGDKAAALSRQHWARFPDFRHEFLNVGAVYGHEFLSFFSLLGWLALLGILVKKSGNRLQAFSS